MQNKIGCDVFTKDQSNPTLVKSLEWLLKQQKEDGEIPNHHTEPPIDQGWIMMTANTVVALIFFDLIARVTAL